VEEDIDRGLGRSRTWLLPFQFLPSPSLLLSLPSQPSLARQQQVSTNLYVVVGLPRCVGLPALPRHANEEGGSLGRSNGGMRRSAILPCPLPPAHGGPFLFAAAPHTPQRRSALCSPGSTAVGLPACLPNSAAGALACTT
jgi:hypothetical protein